MSESSRGHKFIHGIAHHLRRRSEWYWAPTLYLGAVAYLYRFILGGDAGFGWDTIESYWPDLQFLSDHFQTGDLPLWNPFDRGGYPVASDPQAALYYPVQWIFATFGWLFGEASWSLIQAKMLLHHAIGGLCMHIFLRHRRLPGPAAAVGGIALVASAPWLIHKASNILHPLAWTPLIWVAIDRLIAVPNWKRATTLAATVYLAGSAGSPPGFFYALLLCTFYGAFRTLEQFAAPAHPHPTRNFITKFCPAIGFAALLAIGLLWISVAPGLELSEFTPRAQRGLAYALSGPLPVVKTFKAFWAPTAAAQFDAYVGVLTIILISTALVLRPRADRGAPIFFAIAAAFFLALSFGDKTPVLRWLVFRRARPCRRSGWIRQEASQAVTPGLARRRRRTKKPV